MHQMLWRFNTRAHAGVWNFAASAIDVALWDIKGKFYNAPVWRLLGGAQKAIPSYITFGLRAYSRDELAEAARRWPDLEAAAEPAWRDFVGVWGPDQLAVAWRRPEG